ncbi:hypothetical protein [Streptomyces sp. AS02]|nr:hypothetical protein [Streptomyces sp. AS02]
MLFFQSVPDHPRGLVPGMYAAGGLRDVLQLGLGIQASGSA